MSVYQNDELHEALARIAALEADIENLRGVINDAHTAFDTVNASKGTINWRIRSQADRIAALKEVVANLEGQLQRAEIRLQQNAVRGVRQEDSNV